MNLLTRPEAYQDIYLAAVWLDDINAGSGEQFYDAVDRVIADILSQPGFFAPVPRPPRGHQVRQGRIKGYEFLITYEVSATLLTVWAVHHGRQRSQPWRRRMAP